MIALGAPATRYWRTFAYYHQAWDGGTAIAWADNTNDQAWPNSRYQTPVPLYAAPQSYQAVYPWEKDSFRNLRRAPRPARRDHVITGTVYRPRPDRPWRTRREPTARYHASSGRKRT